MQICFTDICWRKLISSLAVEVRQVCRNNRQGWDRLVVVRAHMKKWAGLWWLGNCVVNPVGISCFGMKMRWIVLVWQFCLVGTDEWA